MKPNIKLMSYKEQLFCTIMLPIAIFGLFAPVIVFMYIVSLFF